MKGCSCNSGVHPCGFTKSRLNYLDDMDNINPIFYTETLLSRILYRAVEGWFPQVQISSLAFHRQFRYISRPRGKA